MRFLLTKFLLLAVALPSLAQVSPEEIFTNSLRFYEARPMGQVQLRSLFKSPIAETVSDSYVNICWDRNADECAFWSEGKSTAQVLAGKKYYSLNDKQKSWLDLSSIREDAILLRKKYPFFDAALLNSLRNNNWKVATEGGRYHLRSGTMDLYFDSSDYSLKKFRQSQITQYGVQLTEWELVAERYVNDRTQTDLPAQMKKLKDYNKLRFADIDKNPDWKGKDMRPILGDTLFGTNKLLLVDVFYQSCMPCIASFPRIRQLQADFREKFLMLGVDPMPEDSGSMDRFRKRYNLEYPVLTGQKAQQLNELLNPRHYYPFYLLMDEKGIVIEMQEGMNEKFFDKIRKLLSAQPE